MNQMFIKKRIGVILLSSIMLTTSVFSCMTLTGCGANKGINSSADGTAAGLTGDNSDMTENGGGQDDDAGNTSISNIMAKWGKNNEAAKQRRMQELYMALQPMWNNQGRYPSAWDMTSFYANEAAFQKDYDEVMKWIDTLKDYEGTLNNKESIYNYFQAIEDEKMNEKYNTMLLYCELGESLDVKDTYYKNLNEKLKSLENDFSKATSYAQEEIMELPYEERLEIFEDSDFDDMAYMLSYYKLEDARVFSKETKDAVADLVAAQGGGKDAYETFRYRDMPAPEFEVNGQKVQLTDDVYTSIIQGAFDRDVKIDAYETYTGNFRKYSDTYASFLQTTLSEKWAQAQVYGYDSTLELALDDENLDEEIFTNVIKAAQNASKDYARYISLHKTALNIDKQYMFDLTECAADYVEPAFPYDETIDLIRDSVSVLGDDYADTFMKIIEGGNIDASIGENRDKSTYCMGAGKINMPHVFINYYGEYSDASNLAHELGHAVNYKMSADAQPIWYNDVSIYDTEVCSVMHELLLNAYMVENAKDNEAKLYYLEKLLGIYDSAFFSQCMYSELEDYMYKCIEGKKTLSGEELNKKMAELFKKYRGSDVEIEDSAWIGIDHLHYCYYMYKYATAICYASSLAGDILAGNEKTINAYKEFMSAGSSASSQDTLELAGIDPLNDKTYKDAAAYYASLVDEYEMLLEKCGKISK